VGTFTVVNGRKTGGNVASYFCTPDGRVLHAIAGPVDAATLLREAKWVLDIHEKAKQAGAESKEDYAKFVRQAHADRRKGERGKEETGEESRRSKSARKADANSAALAVAVHRLLAERALEDIEKLYPKVWEGILKEKRSDEPVRFR
jgi:hypothetical protein